MPRAWISTPDTFTHAIRFGYTKFRNGITDATKTASLIRSGISITIGPDPTCLTGGVDAFCSGANLLAPQKTYQQNTQVKYDGSKTIRRTFCAMDLATTTFRAAALPSSLALAPTVNADLPRDFNPANAPFAGGASQPSELSRSTGIHGQRPGILLGKAGIWLARRRFGSGQPHSVVCGRFLEDASPI